MPRTNPPYGGAYLPDATSDKLVLTDYTLDAIEPHPYAEGYQTGRFEANDAIVAPGFTLRFAAEKRLDPRIAFTRASAGTYIDADGTMQTAVADTPRFQHDANGDCLGLLIEEARTNLLTYSEQLSNVAWVSTGITVSSNDSAGLAVFPAMDKVVVNNGATITSSNLSFLVSKSAVATTYVLSVFAKMGEMDGVQLYVRDVDSGSNMATVFCNLRTGALSGLAAAGTFTNAAATVQSMLNGVMRVSLTFTSGTETGIRCRLLARDSVLTLGTGAAGIYLRGAQLEAGAFTTSYIKTEGSTATRAADVATLGGTGFSDWYNATDGSAITWGQPQHVVGLRPIFRFDDGTTDNVISLRGNTTNPELYICAGGVDQATLDAGTIAAGQDYILAATWKANDCGASQSGGTLVTDTSVTLPTPTQLRIGSDGTNYCNGVIRGLTYWPVRLSNAQLQALSR